MIEVEFHPPLHVLMKELDEFGEQIKTRAVASGLVRVAKPIKQSMASLAPIRSGSLKQSIGHRRISKTAKARLGIDQDVVGILVGPTKKVANRSGKKVNQAIKAIWQEYGTERHVIKAKGNGVLASLRSIFGKQIEHPGIKANPFMAKSLEQNAGRIEELFYQGLSSYLDRQKR